MQSPSHIIKKLTLKHTEGERKSAKGVVATLILMTYQFVC